MRDTSLAFLSPSPLSATAGLESGAALSVPAQPLPHVLALVLPPTLTPILSLPPTLPPRLAHSHPARADSLPQRRCRASPMEGASERCGSSARPPDRPAASPTVPLTRASSRVCTRRPRAPLSSATSCPIRSYHALPFLKDSDLGPAPQRAHTLTLTRTLNPNLRSAPRAMSRRRGSAHRTSRSKVSSTAGPPPPRQPPPPPHSPHRFFFSFALRPRGAMHAPPRRPKAPRAARPSTTTHSSATPSQTPRTPSSSRLPSGAASIGHPPCLAGVKDRFFCPLADLCLTQPSRVGQTQRPCPATRVGRADTETVLAREHPLTSDWMRSEVSEGTY